MGKRGARESKIQRVPRSSDLGKNNGRNKNRVSAAPWGKREKKKKKCFKEKK